MNEAAKHGGGLVSQLLNVFLFLGSEWVMYLLIVLSVISVGIALERGWFFAQRRTDLGLLLDELKALLQKGDVQKAREHLRSGRLRRILVPYRQRPTTVNAVFPHSRLLSGKTRAFIDHLVAAWKKEDFDSIPSPPRRQKQGDA